MRGNTRRILRSPEVSLIVPKHPSSSTVSATVSNSATRGVGAYIPIDLNCTIRYSHVLKMDSNILQILLQKRKKYKNTTMNLGYKTLAYCNISLSQVRLLVPLYLSLLMNYFCTNFVWASKHAAGWGWRESHAYLWCVLRTFPPDCNVWCTTTVGVVLLYFLLRVWGTTQKF